MNIEKALAELIQAHCLAVEELTEKQFVEAIRQACACGDFQRLVRAGDGAQSVVYIPFAREQELRARIDELEIYAKNNSDS